MPRRLLSIVAVLAALFAAPGAARPVPKSPSPPPEVPRPVYRDINIARLFGDRAYAEELLRTVDSSAFDGQANGEQNIGFLGIYAIALATAERRQEAGAYIDRMLAARPRAAAAYWYGWLAAGRAQDYGRMVAAMETAARHLPAAERGELFALLPPPQRVFQFAAFLRQDHREAERDRLYEALGAMNWPGEADIGPRDGVRMRLIERRLEQGDRAAAARIARTIETPDHLITLLTTRKYDGLRDAREDPVAAVRNALSGYDRVTAAAVAAYPGDMSRLTERSRFLRSLGRFEEAYSLLSPHLRDVAATVAADEHAVWLVNDAAYALLELGRNDEAVALMSRLVGMEVGEQAELVGPAINHIEVLRAAGRPAEAVAYGERLRSAPLERLANDYGRRWIDQGIICALAELGRRTEAAAQLARMREHADDNPAALTRALICAGDEDAAAALLVRRLGSAEPGTAIEALQRYELRTGAGSRDPILARFDALRDRPEVVAALARVGRSLALPLARTYYGTY